MILILAICSGLVTGLAAAKPRDFLWPGAIYLSGMEYWMWSGSPSPEAQVYLILVQMLAFVSASVGIYTGLMCTGRQHQDPE